MADAAECTQVPAPPTASTSFEHEASSIQFPATPLLSSLSSNVAFPISCAPWQKRKFAAEYKACRKKQNIYHELLNQQTKEECEEQMKLFQFQKEVLQRQLEVFMETCHHIREVVDSCKGKVLDSVVKD